VVPTVAAPVTRTDASVEAPVKVVAPENVGDPVIVPSMDAPLVITGEMRFALVRVEIIPTAVKKVEPSAITKVVPEGMVTVLPAVKVVSPSST
jgi:hypothetical protein